MYDKCAIYYFLNIYILRLKIKIKFNLKTKITTDSNTKFLELCPVVAGSVEGGPHVACNCERQTRSITDSTTAPLSVTSWSHTRCCTSRGKRVDLA